VASASNYLAKESEEGVLVSWQYWTKMQAH